MKLIVALFVLSVPAAAFAQSDAMKTATQLWGDASRMEGEKDYAKALDKYRKSLDKAIADKREDVAAKCLVGIGRCSEQLDNVADALAAYGRIGAEFAGQKEQADWAAEKVKLNGVDVYVSMFAKAVAAWRDTARNHPNGLDEKKKEIWGRIQPLDKTAIYGLIAMLAHPDENVRLFVAVMLCEVIDDIAGVVAKLGDKASTAGAALALNKIFEKWNQASGFDKDAENIRSLLSSVKMDKLPQTPEWEEKVKETRERANQIIAAGPGGTLKYQGQDMKVTADDVAAAKATIARLEDLTKSWGELGKVRDLGAGTNEKNLARAGELAKKAADIRHNIPQTLNSDAVQTAFATLIGNESADPSGRIEALKCLASIGEINGAVVEAVLTALKSTNRNVRMAGCVAAAAVDTSKSEDKHKLVTRLMEIVEHVAEADVEQKDPANDEMVREAACEALGQIAVIRAVPSLIKALSDNGALVRARANDALRAISGKDVGYESEPHVSDPKRELSEKVKREKQIELRKAGIQKWQQWWDETGGIVVLVERFYRFAASWKSFPPAKLFDKEAFLAEIDSQAYAYSDPVDARARANTAADGFQKIKNFHVQDAVDVGATAIDKLVKYLGGVVEGDPKKFASAPTRMFVGEAIAKIATKTGASAVVDRLGDLVGGGATPEEKAGAAVALGFMEKGSVSGGARSNLESRGLTGEAIVKQAAAWALARVGDASSSGKPLADMACNISENAEAAVAGLRAIAALKPQDEGVVTQLALLVADEPEPGTTPKKRAGSDPKDDLVRSSACDALGEIGLASAVKQGLIRARRDTSVNVRDAARKALDKIVQKSGGVVSEIAAVMKDLQAKADDRRGAAMALGVTTTASVPALITTIVDENPPLKLRDPDSSVRAAACRGMGELKDKAKTKSAGDALLSAMNQDIGEEVRAEAYKALVSIGGSGVPEYSATDTQQIRSQNVEKIKVWLSGQNWPEAK